MTTPAMNNPKALATESCDHWCLFRLNTQLKNNTNATKKNGSTELRELYIARKYPSARVDKAAISLLFRDI